MERKTLERARRAVVSLAGDLEIDRRNRPFAARRWDGARHDVPTLHLEDVSGIPFVSVVPGVEEYQHRARVRAHDGDVFVAATEPTEGFESYCRDHLGLGAPAFVLAEADEHSYAVATSCLDGVAFDEIVRIARAAGGLLIHPYMAIETVWELAERVHRAAGCPVQVIGPPPPVLWLANDKQRFTEIVSSVLSDDWVVETHASANPQEMVQHLIRLARHHGRAGLKRTRCASAMGNAVYDLEAIGRMNPEQIVQEVHDFLERTEWALNEEVLIVAWERTDDSPSTQLWIPPNGSGDPIVEGVYEQLLEGEEKIFLGSRPSLLPAPVNATLAETSLQVGAALQALGYAGRCSFDFIVVEDDGSQRVKFVECNGRWGGTSTPMSMIDRIIPGPRPAYRAQDYVSKKLIGVGFPEILRRVGNQLYDPATGRGRFILYNVGPLARTGKLDIIAIGNTPQEAEDAIAGDLPRLLGI